LPATHAVYAISSQTQTPARAAASPSPLIGTKPVSG